MLLVYQGLVDIDKELAKLQSKREKLISQLEKLRKETQIPDYESKVLLFFRVHCSNTLQCSHVNLGSGICAEKQ